MIGNHGGDGLKEDKTAGDDLGYESADKCAGTDAVNGNGGGEANMNDAVNREDSGSAARTNTGHGGAGDTRVSEGDAGQGGDIGEKDDACGLGETVAAGGADGGEGAGGDARVAAAGGSVHGADGGDTGKGDDKAALDFADLRAWLAW